MLYGIFDMTLAVSNNQQWRFLACIDPLAEDIVVHGTDDDLGIESVLRASFQEMSFYDARDVVLVYRIERPALMVLHQKEPVDVINTYKALVDPVVYHRDNRWMISVQKADQLIDGILSCDGESRRFHDIPAFCFHILQKGRDVSTRTLEKVFDAVTDISQPDRNIPVLFINTVLQLGISPCRTY